MVKNYFLDRISTQADLSKKMKKILGADFEKNGWSPNVEKRTK